MDRKEIRLKDLGELLFSDVTLKIIGAYDGKTFISSYNKEKHKAFDDLMIFDLHIDLRLYGGCNNKKVCEPVLVGWAHNAQYKELKEADRVAKEVSKNG